MNIDLKKEEIRKSSFQTGGLIIISILGTAGLLMTYFSGIFAIEDSNMLYECISKNGILIIFGVFFFAVSLYAWILFFLNIILPPKNEILYLNKTDDGEAFFLNKKGKSFSYNMDHNTLEEKSYYNVLKTHNYIYKILEKTNDNWIPKEKKSYWLNYYSPMGNFENIFLLPIVYVILLPGLLSFFISKGYQKIYGVIFSIVPIYAIIYDLIYKIKLKQSDTKEIDETNFVKSYEIMQNSIAIIGVSIMIVILFNIFLKLSDFTSIIIFSPFLCCGLCIFGLVISKVFKNYQLEKLFYKGYVIIFLIYWFGFLSFWTIGIIRQEGNYMHALFSIPFWIFGVFAFYKYIIKKK